MTNKKVGIGSAEFLSTMGYPVAYYPKIAIALGSVKAGIFICQLLYWQGRGKKGEWIYKSRVEMTEETGLSREEQDTARKLLKRLKIIEERLAGAPPITHYKIDFNRFNEIIDNYLIEKEEKEKAEREKKEKKETERNKANNKMIFEKKKYRSI